MGVCTSLFVNVKYTFLSGRARRKQTEERERARESEREREREAGEALLLSWWARAVRSYYSVARRGR